MPLVGSPLETLDYVTASAVSSPAAETAILTTDVVNAGIPPGGLAARPVIIRCRINATPGTGATAFVYRCRQGSGTGGAVVGLAYTQAVGAGNNINTTLQWRDFSGVANAAGTAYTFTIAETGATVAGTVNYADIEVEQ